MDKAQHERDVVFTDGLEIAANLCGSLAETKYDNTDAFEAATGCEAAIMALVRMRRANEANYRPESLRVTGDEA